MRQPLRIRHSASRRRSRSLIHVAGGGGVGHAGIELRHRSAWGPGRASVAWTDIERQVIGSTHAELGAYLLGIWGLLQPIVEAIAYHHAPEAIDPTSPSLATVLHVADGLVHEQCGHADRLDMRHLERLRLTERLESWRSTVADACGASADRGANESGRA